MSSSKKPTTTGPDSSTPYPKLNMPESVSCQKITIWSDGVALDGDIYRPKNLSEHEKVAAIVCCHGLGGDKLSAARYAALLAESGFIAVTFSQSGWGESGSDLLLAGEKPELDENQAGLAKVTFIDRMLDPLVWVRNYRAAVDYIEGEPNVDIDRIGSWGTSFGGSVVAYQAAHDARIKALFTQVSPAFSFKDDQLKLAKQRAIDTARGTFPATPQGVDTLPDFEGASVHYARFTQYDILRHGANINVPMLIMVGEEEQYFDNAENGQRLYEILTEKGQAPVEYEVMPNITHYGVYFDGFSHGSQRALGWFKKYL